MARNYQLRSDEEEKSYLPLIEGWQNRLEDPGTCLQVLSRIMQRNKVTRRKKSAQPAKPKSFAAKAGAGR